MALADVASNAFHTVCMSTTRLMFARGCKSHKVSDAVLHLLPKFSIKLSEKYPTGVADSSFQLIAVLIVPLGCVSRPLNVYLHTVLTGYGIWLC